MSWDRYKETTTGTEFISLTGITIHPRSYCDDPDVGIIGVYISKPPVCKLRVEPLIQFPNTNISWDISDSRSATSTIDEFEIDFGNLTSLTSQDWSSDPKTGTVQYSSVGTYTITATVTDLLGKSATAEVVVQIVPVTVEGLYIATTDDGVYLDDEQLTTGLVRAMRQSDHIWICTEDGLTYLSNESTIEFEDDLDQIDLWFDPYGRIYVLRTSGTQAYVFYSDDYGTTWNSEEIV